MFSHVVLILSCAYVCMGQLTDEYTIYEKACLGEDRFACFNGGCILQSQYCDGNYDCDDKSDEEYCAIRSDLDYCNQPGGYKFHCADKKMCLPDVMQCNGVNDCADGSDEVNCTLHVNVTSSHNSTCKGFLCGDGKCISKLWKCDGVHDCDDKSDEDTDKLCKHALKPHTINDGASCMEFFGFFPRQYKCNDESFCLQAEMMCDGIQDCRDGSDEGNFCKDWKTMCTNISCSGDNRTICYPDRGGAHCVCLHAPYTQLYDDTTRDCQDVDDCSTVRPICSQECRNRNGSFTCHCEDGYEADQFKYICIATGPEALLFYSTPNEIRYLKVKSRQEVIVATGIRQAHGVAYDGKHVYWVETAEGRESVIRAQLNDVQGTKEVIVGIGLEDPGDIAIDYLGGNLYLTDAERGLIFACKLDGSMCTTIKTQSRHPKFLSLDVKHGKMYWADYHGRAIIMSASMDGSNARVLVDKLRGAATGLSVDAANRRMYYVDHTVMAVRLDDGNTYPLFIEQFHHPYAISVFESSVYWTDLTTNSIQLTDKLHPPSVKRDVLRNLDVPVFDMHIYHSALFPNVPGPCHDHVCSHLCLLTSNTTYTCACPHGMELIGTVCQHQQEYRPHYLVIGGGSSFTKIEYDVLSNPETHARYFNIGRVQAMAYDSLRDNLYIYDGLRKTINFISMAEFTLGATEVYIEDGLVNVVDMDYDFVTDTLYILDSGLRHIEVVSLKTNQRALLYYFPDEEVPISFCLLPQHGKLLVAVLESEQNNVIHVDSLALDGGKREHILMNTIKGPRVRVRFEHNMDNVLVSDDGHGTIDIISHDGSGRELFRQLQTAVTELAVTDTLVFWTDRHTNTLYWADIHETYKIRRIDLSIFDNATQLHILPTLPYPDSNPLLTHPCRTIYPCSHVCVQSKEQHYKCLCARGFVPFGGVCAQLVGCSENELYCHKSNICFPKSGRCDGKKDCLHGEDEELCELLNNGCPLNETRCNDKCIDKNHICTPEGGETRNLTCSSQEFTCWDGLACVDRGVVCDAFTDCADGSDEAACETLACLDTEFMCSSGSCKQKIFQCDGEMDCEDGSDEYDCEEHGCSHGYFSCGSQCVEVSKRCDQTRDCVDGSDELHCDYDDDDSDLLLDIVETELPACNEKEHACEHNVSICIPLTARCNGKTDCPGGTDEHGCDFMCAPRGMFQCRLEARCVSMTQVCDAHTDCQDGSDETQDACDKVNKTSRLFPSPLYPPEECADGFLCGTGQCIEWRQVCDKSPHCFDNSDENGLCLTACDNATCSHTCVPTPQGPRCTCPAGLHAGTGTGLDSGTCRDIDECARDVCSQKCTNTYGSFICSCYDGFALRSDRRSCKSTQGRMSIVFVSDNSLRRVAADGRGSVLYNDMRHARLTDMDLDIRRDKIYITIAEDGKLIELNNSNNNTISITNIGRPTKVAVDWVTGNVYFVDATPSNSYIRVCNFVKRKCARIHKVTDGAEVKALAVTPGTVYYCSCSSLECGAWSLVPGTHTALVSLVTVAVAVAGCSGLAPHPRAPALYVSQLSPPSILHLHTDNNTCKKIFANDRHLQAPQALSIFEDHLYFLSGSSFVSRCSLYGHKTCEHFMYKVFDAHKFVINQTSVQRDDIADVCVDMACDGVCVSREGTPVCLCEDGTISWTGACSYNYGTELAIFSAWSTIDSDHALHANVLVVVILSVLFMAYLSLFLYYQYRKRAKNAAMPVRFHNPQEETVVPTLDMPTSPTASSNASHEFVNPLQYVRNIWSSSLGRQGKPIGTAGLTIDVPYAQDLSDTESDLDDRDTRRFFNTKSFF